MNNKNKPIQVEIIPDTMLFRLLNNEEVSGITIPKGFITDFASVPKIFWFFIPPMGKHNRAALMHDYLCWSSLISREDADYKFYKSLKEHGVSKGIAKIMHLAVRVYARTFLPFVNKNKKRKI